MSTIAYIGVTILILILVVVLILVWRLIMGLVGYAVGIVFGLLEREWREYRVRDAEDRAKQAGAPWAEEWRWERFYAEQEEKRAKREAEEKITNNPQQHKTEG